MFNRQPCMVSYSRNNSNNGEELISNILKNSTCEENAQNKSASLTENCDINEQINQLDFSSDKPWIIFLGLPKSGKTSIFNTLFKNMSVYDCLFLESTTKIEQHYICNSALVQFNILDFPGDIDVSLDEYDFSKIFNLVHTIVFVINTQSDQSISINYLINVMNKVSSYNNEVYYEIFLHKSDGIPRKFRMGPHYRQQMQTTFVDVINQQCVDDTYIRYHYSTIFDYSTYAAFSKICRNTNKNIEYLESILNITRNACKMEKIFLVDIETKIFAASDCTTTSGEIFELSCDMVEIANDFCEFYKVSMTDENRQPSPRIITSDSPVYYSVHTEKHNFLNITLDNKRIVHMLEISPYLIALMFVPKYVVKKAPIFRYNINCFYDAVLNLLPPRQPNHPCVYVTGRTEVNVNNNTYNDKCVVINNHIRNKSNSEQCNEADLAPRATSNSIVNSLSVGYKFF